MKKKLLIALVGTVALVGVAVWRNRQAALWTEQGIGDDA